MPNIQKSTFINLIMSLPFSEDSFASKSITLDFLYGFDNSCTAIVCLNEYISEDNHLASMSLKCIYGVLLAVEEYKYVYPTVITQKFIMSLINIIIYKLGDSSLTDYLTCMKKILDFIGKNLSFRLLGEYVKLGSFFIYSDLNNGNIKEVFEKYCDTLSSVLSKFIKDDSSALNYKIESFQNMYGDKINSNNDEKEKEVLNRIYNILKNANKCNIYIIANKQDLTGFTINELKNISKLSQIRVLRKESIRSFSYKYEDKIIFLLDFNEDDWSEMLSLLGCVANKVKGGNVFACF